eukprot:CAMPEP_0178796572 /NCGR_PEP_ID=MMETSP0745-20121128/10736_1 /TAXON_ID=913974 /ORGANISM="Nitzschia punctata, Strain CCMP561" /LENGTH=103 /DNA_ID=CAMNT_0020455051 /DNA_START=144 /DNA_END=455 /DNA_ORIENTATION=+
MASALPNVLSIPGGRNPPSQAHLQFPASFILNKSSSSLLLSNDTASLGFLDTSPSMVSEAVVSSSVEAVLGLALVLVGEEPSLLVVNDLLGNPESKVKDTDDS